MATLINTPGDMRWLRGVHWPDLPVEYHSAVIHGNEDWPTRIEAYTRRNPLVTDIPLVLDAVAINGQHGPRHAQTED